MEREADWIGNSLRGPGAIVAAIASLTLALSSKERRLKKTLKRILKEAPHRQLSLKDIKLKTGSRSHNNEKGNTNWLSGLFQEIGAERIIIDSKEHWRLPWLTR